eukprot:TRINITY_DN4463_c0_g1_i3.p2 TRINITY_DN4463_c0_g1~~TRINITY_DN4463_c0_g1_i3.p2  ORF type:complete len:148 (-),score=31.20 TRINITY_DN4463_c0_g1_i3:31-474(-)
MLVFDVANEETRAALRDWAHDVEQFCDKTVQRIMVGNKADTVEGQPVGALACPKGKEMADELKMQYFETSAKTGEGVAEAFYTIASLVLKRNDFVPANHTSVDLRTQSVRGTGQRPPLPSQSSQTAQPQPEPARPVVAQPSSSSGCC